MKVENGMQLCLSKKTQRFQKLMDSTQVHSSHYS